MTDRQPSPPSEPGDTQPGQPGSVGGGQLATPRTVTFNHIVELQELARRRWDTAIIVALGTSNRPSRFVDVRDAAARWVGQTCHNAELARTLPKLVAAGYIAGPDDGAEGLYALTDRGRARLAVINALGCALDKQPTSRLTNLSTAQLDAP